MGHQNAWYHLEWQMIYWLPCRAAVSESPVESRAGSVSSLVFSSRFSPAMKGKLAAVLHGARVTIHPSPTRTAPTATQAGRASSSSASSTARATSPPGRAHDITFHHFFYSMTRPALEIPFGWPFLHRCPHGQGADRRPGAATGLAARPARCFTLLLARGKILLRAHPSPLRPSLPERGGNAPAE